MLYTGLGIAIAMGGFVGLADAAPTEAGRAAAMPLAPNHLTIRAEREGFVIAPKADNAFPEARELSETMRPLGSTIRIDRRLLRHTPSTSRRMRDAQPVR